jgi:hypothetical protein
MPRINVVTDGNHERLRKHLKLDQLPVFHTMTEWTIDLVRGGMRSGASSLVLMIPVRIGDNNVMVAAETSLNCWMMAASALAGACRDEVERPGFAKLNEAARTALLPRFAEGIRRSIPSATVEQATEAAEMFLDAVGADEPPDWATGEATG